jgi:F-type H+-transporting ATPase subunit b
MELFAEIGREIAADPVKYGVEVLQFVILVALVWFVAMGLGKRKGMVVKILEGRRSRVASDLEGAAHAEERLESARAEAAEKVAAAKAESTRIVREARRMGRAETKSVLTAAKDEAAAMRRRAEEILEGERADMHRDVREQLVGLVALATRSILNESYSAAEQREMVQASVLAGIERIEDSAATAPARAREGSA